LGGVIGPRERGLPARDLPSRGLPARDGLSPRLLDDLGEDALDLLGVVGIAILQASDGFQKNWLKPHPCSNSSQVKPKSSQVNRRLSPPLLASRAQFDKLPLGCLLFIL
jgi:hypothetical protein